LGFPKQKLNLNLNESENPPDFRFAKMCQNRTTFEFGFELASLIVVILLSILRLSGAEKETLNSNKPTLKLSDYWKHLIEAVNYSNCVARKARVIIMNIV